SDPVLDDLVHLALRHYSLESDHCNGIHATLHDVFVTMGVNEEDIKTFAMGASSGLALPGKPDDNKAEYVGAPGNGLEAGEKKLEVIERRMAVLGLSMLVRPERTDRTATEDENEKAEQDSDLGR